MQLHEKSVKLFAECLFLFQVLENTFVRNKRKQFTPEDVNLRNSFSRTLEIFQTSKARE